jgi:hypothetical protein
MGLLKIKNIQITGKQLIELGYKPSKWLKGAINSLTKTILKTTRLNFILKL